MAYVVTRFFIPKLRDRQVVSSFEYLRECFSPLVSRCAVSVYLLQSLLYLSVTLYTPSLALAAVVDIPFNAILAVLFVIATVTTALGGMKAVLLTDVVFGFVIFIGQFAILIESFWNAPEELNIYSFNATFESTESIWSWSLYSAGDLVVGGFFMCVYLYGVNQASVHRYLSASSTSVANCSMWLTAAALEVILLIGLAFGWLLKVHYPSNQLPDGVTSRDQLLIYYVFSRYRYVSITRQHCYSMAKAKTIKLLRHSFDSFDF